MEYETLIKFRDYDGTQFVITKNEYNQYSIFCGADMDFMVMEQWEIRAILRREYMNQLDRIEAGGFRLVGEWQRSTYPVLRGYGEGN